MSKGEAGSLLGLWRLEILFSSGMFSGPTPNGLATAQRLPGNGKEYTCAFNPLCTSYLILLPFLGGRG
jgi:hypothetical protein